MAKCKAMVKEKLGLAKPATSDDAGSMTDDETDDLLGLVALWNDLGPRERKVFATIGVRLLAGQAAYGALHKGKKNWRREAQEEAMDMCVYLAAQLEDSYEDG